MEGLLQQIIGYNQFVDSQHGLLPPDVIAGSTKGMVNNLLIQFANIPLTAACATRLNTAIAAAKFSPDQKTQLATAIANRVSTAQVASTKTQTLKAVLGYFTATDWSVFESESMQTIHKVGRLADRCRLLGLVNPSEATVKHLAAVIAVAHCPTAQPADLYPIVVQVKAAIQHQKCAVTTLMANYPDCPSDLPKEVYDSAYPSDPPIVKKCPGFVAVLGNVPLRKTNRAVSNQPAASHDNITAENVVQKLLHLMQPQHQPQVLPAITLTPYGTSIARGCSFSSSSGGWDCSTPVPRSSSPGPAALVDALRPMTGDHPPSPASPAAKMTSTLPPPAKGGDELDAAADDDAVDALEAAAAKAAARPMKGSGAAPAKRHKSKATKKGKSKAKAALKRPGAAPTVTVPPPAQTVKPTGAAPTGTVPPPARAAGAAMKRPASAALFALGCGKCRGSPSGCGQCKQSWFTGRRFTRK